MSVQVHRQDDFAFVKSLRLCVDVERQNHDDEEDEGYGADQWNDRRPAAFSRSVLPQSKGTRHLGFIAKRRAGFRSFSRRKLR